MRFNLFCIPLSTEFLEFAVGVVLLCPSVMRVLAIKFTVNNFGTSSSIQLVKFVPLTIKTPVRKLTTTSIFLVVW